MLKLDLLRAQSLKTRITVLILVVMLLCIAGFATYLSVTLRVDLQRNIGKQQFSTAIQVAANIDSDISNRIQALQRVATDIKPSMLADLPALQNHLQQRRVFLSLFNDSVLVFQADGLAIAELPLNGGHLGKNHADRDDFKGAIKGKVMIGKPHFSNLKKVPEFRITVPIAGPTGEVIGVLAGLTNLAQSNFLDDHVSQRYGDSGGYVLVAAQHRLVVTATDKSRSLEQLPPLGVNPTLDRFFQGYEGTANLISPLGQSILAADKGVPSAGWVLAVVLPTEEAFAPIRSLQMRMLQTALLFGVLGGGLIWWLLRRELSPMLSTVHTLTRLAASDQPPSPLPIARDDEIGKLIGGFNRLLGKLNQRELVLKKMVAESKNAEAELRIAATALESRQGMAITDAQCLILRVNQAFSQITGYSPAEVVGRNPHLLASGRHDKAFYNAMWQSIALQGSWQGEIWNRRKNGEVYPEWLSISSVKDAAGRITNYVATFSDISASKSAEDQIFNLAFYDPLTKLPNRRLLLDRLAQAVVTSSRHHKNGALLYIDLDDFKILNETLGHVQGDALLQCVARRVSDCLREGDTAARLGGDEFVVMLEDLVCDEVEASTIAENLANRISEHINRSYTLGQAQQHITASIGIALFGDAHTDSEKDEPLKRAELAMYQAKAAGRNLLRFFDNQMQVVVSARATLENDLRHALVQRQFVLFYQAQVVDAGRVTGAEVLVRWQHPQHGLVSPADFIPLAEETGLILPLGQWVLETACEQLAIWAGQPAMADMTLAVNVSVKQFQQTDFVAQVQATLERTGANPKRLKLELTESLLVHDVEGTIAKMTVLKRQGVAFSLDDFGTGYSSLSYLKRLPLDQLKIDQGFVKNILSDTNDAAIAKMVMALAETMCLGVIAEGVEEQAQKEFLADLGCHSYQGYLFSRPVPLADFEGLADRLRP